MAFRLLAIQFAKVQPALRLPPPKSGAAARGISAVGNYLGEASGLTPAIPTLIPDTVAESVGRTTAAARRSADRWAGSDPDRQAYVEAGAAISGAALDATWGKGAAKAAKAAKGKKAKHAERGGRHPDSGYPDSGNPAQAYARSAGRYADNIPRGGVSHDFADAYRYRQIGKAAESRFGNPSRFGRNPAEARPKPKTDSPKTRPGKNKTCSFHGSTLVKTHTGYKAIADIRTGDRVLAKNELNGETAYKTVTAQYSNPYAQTVYIRIGGANGKVQTLIANTIHPFFTNGRWAAAGSLKAGDVLLDENGAAQTVQSVETKAEELTAYNLTVADFHTYFVKGAGSGTDAVWVHNDCDPADRPDVPKKELVTTTLGNQIDITPSANHSRSPDGVVPPLVGQLPNSSVDIYGRDGTFVTRRFYDKNGNIIRDVHMTDHGNRKLHPEVPHEHLYGLDENGKPRRIK